MQAGTCKHFNGTTHNTCCDAGVLYREVTPDPDRLEGSGLRIPCRAKLGFRKPSPKQLEEFEKRGTCDKYTEPTAREIADYDAAIQARIQQFTLMIPLLERVKRDHAGQQWRGIEECPVCKGRLHITHAAYNGHVWGKCETHDCLNFAE